MLVSLAALTGCGIDGEATTSHRPGCETTADPAYAFMSQLERTSELRVGDARHYIFGSRPYTVDGPPGIVELTAHTFPARVDCSGRTLSSATSWYTVHARKPGRVTVRFDDDAYDITVRPRSATSPTAPTG